MQPQKNMTQDTNRLTDEQIAKIEDVLSRLSVFNRNNSVAIVLIHNLKMAKDYSEKRKWIVMFYAQSFQMLSMINMAMQNEDSIQVFESKLNDLFRKSNEPTKQ